MQQAVQMRAEGPKPVLGKVIPLRPEDPVPGAQIYKAKCSVCSLRPLCLASGLKDDDLALLQSVLGQWRTVHRGDYLFRVGDPLQSLYTVRSGSFKTVTGHEDSLEHVAGYILPGDMLGLGAIGDDRYDCDAIALEDSTVCVMPFVSIEALGREGGVLQHRLYRRLSREIVRESHQMVLLSGMSSERRVATFLLSVSARLRERGYAAREFTLRMTRQEIGSHLGIKLETVSRTFSRFQREGLIRVDGKAIEIFDVDALARI